MYTFPPEPHLTSHPSGHEVSFKYTQCTSLNSHAIPFPLEILGLYSDFINVALETI